MSSSTSVDDAGVDQGRRRWRQRSGTPVLWLLLSHGKIQNVIFLFRWERQVHYRQQEALEGSEIIAFVRRISYEFIKIMLGMLEGAMLWFLQTNWHLWEVDRTFHIDRTFWNRSTVLHLYIRCLVSTRPRRSVIYSKFILK
jgi:hypothetical protein